MEILITATHPQKSWFGYDNVTYTTTIALLKEKTYQQQAWDFQEKLSQFLNETKPATELNIKLPNQAPQYIELFAATEIRKKSNILKTTFSKKTLSPEHIEQLNNIALFNTQRFGILLGFISGITSSLHPGKILFSIMLNWAIHYFREKDAQYSASKYDTKAKIKSVKYAWEKAALQKGVEADTWLGYGKTFFSPACWWNRRACVGAIKIKQNDQFDCIQAIKKLKI